ncbi:MAG: hypothetical protein ACI9U2_002601 [Bradymonadia bacterium]|jgi:hypothetical protein
MMRWWLSIALLFGLGCDDGAGGDPSPDALQDDMAVMDAALERDACTTACDGGIRLVDFGEPPPPPDAMVEQPLRPIDEGCSDLYSQDILPVYYVDIDPEEWAAIQDEFANWQAREAMGLPIKPYHPVARFRYEGEVVLDAQIRLKANNRFSWVPPKMQFVINFRKEDRSKRFHGQRKLNLDAPWYDPTLLRERVALSFLREAGLPAACANNAVLFVNNAFYGLYTNKEHVDKEFLERNFDDPEGDLWKYGWEIRTNSQTATPERRDALWGSSTIEDFGQLVDREQTVKAWAAESMLPHHDGYVCCNHNFYVYDHPSRGFQFVLHDLDIAYQGFDMTNPTLNLHRTGQRRADHFGLAMADPEWRQDFARAVEEMRELYDPVEFERRLDTWTAQTAVAFASDPNLPFEREDRRPALAKMRAFFAPRRAYIDAFTEQALACDRGDPGRDRDGDGVDECSDCDDLNRQIRPGNPDACNEQDDDCDGRVDEDQVCADCAVVEGETARYALCAAPQAWFDGHRTCARQGGIYAIPLDDADRMLLAEAAGMLLNDRWWIGANDGSEEERWSNREGVQIEAPPFAEGQPNGGDDQNCATLDPSRGGAWADEDCLSALPVICQLPLD